MDEEVIEQSTPSVNKFLTERVDILQRKISELQDQVRDVQNQIDHYTNLLRHYRRVMEAESLGLGYKPSLEVAEAQRSVTKSQKRTRQTKKLSVAKAVGEVMAARRGEEISQSRVYDLIRETYPDLTASRGEEIMSAVAHALIRGVYKHQWKRIKPGHYIA